MAASVLFVCLGNICRSPSAEGAFAAIWPGEVDSAGLGAWHVGDPPDGRAVAAAAKQGVDLSDQRARKVTAADFERFDLILAMDHSVLEALEELRPNEATARLELFGAYGLDHADIPDPYYAGGFDAVYGVIAEGCAALADALSGQEQ